MYKFYCDAFQLHLAASHLCLDPRNYESCTDEEAAAVALAASDVRRNRDEPRTKAEVEQEVRRLLAPSKAEASTADAPQEVPDALRIAIAHVRPGDVVVATYDRERFTHDEVRGIIAPVIEPLGAHLAAAPEGVELSVVRPELASRLSTGPEAAQRWRSEPAAYDAAPRNEALPERTRLRFAEAAAVVDPQLPESEGPGAEAQS